MLACACAIALCAAIVPAKASNEPLVADGTISEAHGKGEARILTAAPIHALSAIGQPLKIVITDEIFKNEDALRKTKRWKISRQKQDKSGLSVIFIEPTKRDLEDKLIFGTSEGIKTLILYSGPQGGKVSAPIVLRNYYLSPKSSQKQITSQPITAPIKAETVKRDVNIESANTGTEIYRPEKQKIAEIREISFNENAVKSAPLMDEVDLPNFTQPVEITNKWTVHRGDYLCSKIQEWANHSGWQVSCEADAEILGDVSVNKDLPLAINQLVKAIGADKFKIRIYKQNKMIRISDYQ